MRASRIIRGVLRHSAVGLLCFTPIALLFSGQVWVDYAYGGQRVTWGRAFAVALIEWEPWGLLVPAIAWLARRWPFSIRRWRGPLAVHAIMAVGFSALKIVIETAASALLLGPAVRPFQFLKIYLTLLTYWAIVVAIQVLDQARAGRARELRAKQLEVELARAQIEALKMQIHPHFLFNTLNTIAGLMREDVEAADVMIARLADLLRRTFESEGIQEVSLDRELQFLDTYLGIQHMRLGDRLQVSIDAPGDARGRLVPNLILQPLVENAIRHGVAARPGPGIIRIEARVEGGTLAIQIVNDGPPLAAAARDGYGLRNTRSRLRALYGGDAAFTLTGRPEGGAIARMTLPARPAEPS